MFGRRVRLAAAAAFLLVLCVLTTGLAKSAHAAGEPSARIASPACGSDATITLINPTTTQVHFALMRSTSVSSWNDVYLQPEHTTVVSAAIGANGEIMSVEVDNKTLARRSVSPSTFVCSAGAPTLPALSSGFSATINAPTCGNAATIVIDDELEHALWFDVNVIGNDGSDITLELGPGRITSLTEVLPASNTTLEVLWNQQVLARQVVSPAPRCASNRQSHAARSVKPATTTVPKACAAADKLPSWGGCPVFEDDFNGASVNTADNGWWIYNYPNDPSHPRVAQNLAVANSQVQLEGTYNRATGVALGAGIESQFAQKYGRWEVRARVDKGAGFSAVSLLWPGADEWPAAGEMDLYEVPKDPRSEVFQAAHNDPNNDQVNRSSAVDATQWHNYAIEWTPTLVTFFIDNALQWSESSLVPNTAPMHVTLQMDPGCDSWYECPNSSTPPVQSMWVDSVKAWTYKG